MPRLRTADPLWLAHRAGRDGPRYPELASDLRADVAIVGGGITGAAVAWMFARAGVRVVVVDAARVGRLSSAAARDFVHTLESLDIRCRLEHRDSVYYAPSVH